MLVHLLLPVAVALLTGHLTVETWLALDPLRDLAASLFSTHRGSRFLGLSRAWLPFLWLPFVFPDDDAGGRHEALFYPLALAHGARGSPSACLTCFGRILFAGRGSGIRRGKPAGQKRCLLGVSDGRALGVAFYPWLMTASLLRVWIDLGG